MNASYICKKIIFNKLFEKKKLYEIVNKDIWRHDDQSINSHVKCFSNKNWFWIRNNFFNDILGINAIKLCKCNVHVESWWLGHFSSHLWLKWYRANASFKLWDYYFQLQIIYAWLQHTSSPSKIIISFVICEGSLTAFKKHLKSLMNIYSPTMMVIGSKWCKIPQCKWYIDSNHC
jgi:hypothetical protein